MSEAVISGSQPDDLEAEYDYIVVGVGAAGCVMAHRLSQDGRFRVLAIEGGGTAIAQEKIADPRLWATNFGTDSDWCCTSTPQPHLNGRRIATPVGRIVGGGSSINATVWLNGDKADYDAWEQAAGPGWGFEHIVRNFKKTERFAGGESAMRGGAGMIATRTSDKSHPVTRAFIESAVACGKTEHPDVNDIAHVGDAAGQKDINTDAQIRRVSAAHGYLVPALNAPEPDAADRRGGDQARHRARRLPRRRGRAAGRNETHRRRQGSDLERRRLDVAEALDAVRRRPRRSPAPAWHCGRRGSAARRAKPARSSADAAWRSRRRVRRRRRPTPATPASPGTKAIQSDPGPTSRFSAGCIRRAWRG